MEYLADHALSGVPHTSHTVSVASGIKPDFDSVLLIKVVIALVFNFCFILVFQSKHQPNPAFLFVAKESLKRRLPASRAPPQF